ncbi:MAG: hypothetical protein HDT28_03665 [Clostridiales bacterium]|nr:hypothetical protein [Clostridiales bacterium]
MKCTKCGLREATTDVYVRHNDNVEKMCLCSECAKSYTPNMGFDNFDMLSKLINGSPMGLLSNLNGLFQAPKTRALICPNCKTTSEDFIKTGFVGCPHCYDVFEPIITQSVKRLQQADRHVGKVPQGEIDTATEEARLKSELQAAIDSGDYAKIGELGERLKTLVGNKRGN